MSEWRTMQAGAELNMLIALRLGYTIEEHDVKPDYHGVGYWLKRPDGRYVWGGGSSERPSVNRWEPIDFFREERFAPDWSRSVDAALTLPTHGKVVWDIRIDGDEHQVHLYNRGMDFDDDNWGKRWEGNDDLILPASMCYAWLTWQENTAPTED